MSAFVFVHVCSLDFKNKHQGQAWWCLPESPALWRLKQEGYSELEASLDYTARPYLKESKTPSSSVFSDKLRSRAGDAL